MSAIDIGKNIFAAIGIASVGAIGTIATGAFGYWNTDRSQDIQMVSIALSILAGENKDTSLPGRKFALRVLEEHAKVDIPDKEFEDWAAIGTLPSVLYQPDSQYCMYMNSRGQRYTMLCRPGFVGQPSSLLESLFQSNEDNQQNNSR